MSNPVADHQPEHNYVLGHAKQELDRLGTQARMIDPLTRRVLLEAGIGPGLRVLDVGSGAGHLAFLAAELVGEAGEVVGLDRSPVALEAARAGAAARRARKISFLEGDAAAMTFEQSFDAVIGRYVLMFQPDPTVMLQALARHVRPGGVMVFHEIDWWGARSFPPAPLYDQCCRWIVETLRRGAAEPYMGVKLTAAFIAAGLPAPELTLQSIIGGGVNSSEAAHLAADLAGSMVAEMERLGVVTAAEVDSETLADRIIKQAIAGSCVLVGRAEIGAWARV
jgi:SAM-dependent methyltransferase